MIRVNAPRPARAGVALAGVAGLLALAGCASTAATAETNVTSTSQASDVGTTTSDTGSGSSSDAYKDGTYTATGTYTTPESVETVDVTVTLKDDVVTAVEVSGDPQTPEAQQYQSRFIGGISAVVVGKDIDQLSVSRVAGSSLTSGGFNQAIEKIKQEAAS